MPSGRATKRSAACSGESDRSDRIVVQPCLGFGDVPRLREHDSAPTSTITVLSAKALPRVRRPLESVFLAVELAYKGSKHRHRLGQWERGSLRSFGTLGFASHETLGLSVARSRLLASFRSPSKEPVEVVADRVSHDRCPRPATVAKSQSGPLQLGLHGGGVSRCALSARDARSPGRRALPPARFILPLRSRPLACQGNRPP